MELVVLDGVGSRAHVSIHGRQDHYVLLHGENIVRGVLWVEGECVVNHAASLDTRSKRFLCGGARADNSRAFESHAIISVSTHVQHRAHSGSSWAGVQCVATNRPR